MVEDNLMVLDHLLINCQRSSEAVGDKLEIILDGGIRRGTHVLKGLIMQVLQHVVLEKAFYLPLGAGGQAGS